jgi:hypothetical protein
LSALAIAGIAPIIAHTMAAKANRRMAASSF